jgi:signal transduction histidine kinase
MEALNAIIDEKRQINFQKLTGKSSYKNVRQLRVVSSEEKFDKQDVVRTISHEIRTPLNVINLAMEIVDDNNVQGTKDEICNLIKHAGQRLIRTVENIMEISILESRGVSIEKKYLNVVEEIIQPVFDDYKDIAEEKNNRLHLYNKTKNSFEFVDKYFVDKAIKSIMDNAIKFTDNGIICAHIYRDNLDRLVIEISDTGIGISEEFKDKIFTPFSQESNGITREYLGLGLDLYLAKLALACTDADIKVHSLKEYGTKFTITFTNQYEG